MRIERLTYCTRELPLVRPLHTARGTINSRRSVYVAVHADDGCVGVGEAAPLPEFGTETVEEVLADVERLVSAPDMLGEWPAANALGNWPDISVMDTSERRTLTFALHSAMTSLLCRYRNITASELFQRPVETNVNVNALVSGKTTDAVLQQADNSVDNGFGTLKIKVGFRPLAEEIKLLTELRVRHPGIHLRADANRAWTFAESLEFFKGVASANLEYVEDPLREATARDLLALNELRLVPIALDSSLGDAISIEQAVCEPLCDVLVLKPSIIGSWMRLKDVADKAALHGKAVIISSLIESELSLAYLTHCAALFGAADFAHGIGTGSYLSKGALDPPFRIVSGKIELPDLPTLHQRLPKSVRRELGITE